jgi:hypothetical protein
MNGGETLPYWFIFFICHWSDHMNKKQFQVPYSYISDFITFSYNSTIFFVYTTRTTNVQTVFWLKTTNYSESEVNYSYNQNYDLAVSKDSNSASLPYPF